MSARPSRIAAVLKICAYSLALCVALAAVAFVASNRAPSWWVDPVVLADCAQSESTGRELEQQLAATISKIRPAGESWAIRIRDEDINAWIAARLPQWKEHDPLLAWPVAGAATQIRFNEQSATIAIAMEGRVWSGSCAITVVPGAIAIVPEAGAIGLLPIPGGAALALRWLEGEGAKTLRLPRTFNLGDGRQVEVLHIDLHQGTIEIECATH
ncbi:MAG: hypothetical protein EXS17_03145 [Phycisphaerales bacterium]|nr:hypothetical protein [Phycisphaerales bacterium]